MSTKNQQEKRQPWMKFYPADWQADEGLGQCSLTARGLWIELIAIMHKSDTFGHLLIAKKAPTDAQIAIQVKSDTKTVKKCLEELEQWRVFSRTESGIIYSRRMLADAEKARIDKQNGKGGGNPKLIGKTAKGVNPQDKPEDIAADNGADKAQKLEARSQKLEVVAATGTGGEGGASPPIMPCRNDPPHKWIALAGKAEIDKHGVQRPVCGEHYLDLAADAVCEAAKIRQESWRGDWRPLIAWLQEGMSVEKHIVPAIRRVASRPGYQPPGSLKYFDNPVREAFAEAAA